jgi:hypothetical protein
MGNQSLRFGAFTHMGPPYHSIPFKSCVLWFPLPWLRRQWSLRVVVWLGGGGFYSCCYCLQRYFLVYEAVKAQDGFRVI